MAVSAIVSNATGAAITQGANTIPAHGLLSCSLAVGDADALITAGCVISPVLTVAKSTQEAAYMLLRNPGAY
jgi:hypothetical protein